MLQLLDFARENAALKCELARIRREVEALRRDVSFRSSVERRRVHDAEVSFKPSVGSPDGAARS